MGSCRIETFVSKQLTGALYHAHTLSKGFAKILIGMDDASKPCIFMDNGGETFDATRKSILNNGIAYSIKENVGSGTRLSGFTDSTKNIPPSYILNIWIRTA